MEWRGRRGSSNIEDRRSMGAAGVGGMGIVGMLIVLAVGYFFGVDISPVVSAVDSGGQPTEQRELTQAERESGEFVSVILADTEEIWTDVLREQANMTYQVPQLVMFSGATQSGCGGAQGAMGPFYCPVDKKVYLDTNFFETMQAKLGAGGDFANAYVIAHEIGHHVQDQLGILGKVTAMRQRVSESDSNQLSVLTELQADCFAGIWARHAQQRFGGISQSDVNDAINAARAVGDDILMERAGRTPMPDAFTHGSAQQRSTWLMRGMKSGDIAQCNTFKEAGL